MQVDVAEYLLAAVKVGFLRLELIRLVLVCEVDVVEVDGAVHDLHNGVLRVGDVGLFVEHLADTACARHRHGDHNEDHGEHHQGHQRAHDVAEQ